MKDIREGGDQKVGLSGIKLHAEVVLCCFAEESRQLVIGFQLHTSPDIVSAPVPVHPPRCCTVRYGYSARSSISSSERH